MKLSLKENADFSFYYAIKHFHTLDDSYNDEKVFLDSFVLSKKKTNSFYISYNEPDVYYQNRLSHQLCVQSFELYLKDIVAKEKGENLIFSKDGRTIGLYKAISLYNEFAKNKIDKIKVENIKELRNLIEHYKVNESHIRLISDIKHLVYEISLIFKAYYKYDLLDYFSFDVWTEDFSDIEYKIKYLL